MAIIVSDSFNRANDPTSLGTTDTGQAWTQNLGTASFGINSNTALWTWNSGDPAGIVTVETGFQDAITSVTLNNPNDTATSFGIAAGVVFRLVDVNYHWRLMYFRIGVSSRLRLQRVYAGGSTTVIDIGVVLSNGDNIAAACCGSDFEIFINDVSQGTYDDSMQPQNYGTRSGLIGSPGTYFATILRNFDDFLVETNGTCTPTYNCTGSGCVDPGDGTGTYATLAACLAGCDISESYNCVDGVCTDPGDGSGEFATLLECQTSGCGAPPSSGISTMQFDGGTGSSYYIVPPVVDSGEELRSKVIKAARVIGKVSDAALQVYAYDIGDNVDVDDLEAGTNSTTGDVTLTDTTGVAQSPRAQVNCPNAVLSTIRVEGTWDATDGSEPDRIDEIVYEQAEQGVRR